MAAENRWGGNGPQVNDPNQWGSGGPLSQYATIPSIPTQINAGFGKLGIKKNRFGNNIFNNLFDEDTGAGKIFGALGGTQGVTEMLGGLGQLLQPGNGTGDGSALGNMIGNIGSKIGGKLLGIGANPMSGIAGAASTFGVNAFGKIFGKDTNYSDAGSNIVNGIADGLNFLGPAGMAASFAVKMANMLGSKKVQGVKHDEQTQRILGSAFNLSQYDRETKNFGLIGRGKANKYEDEVEYNKKILERADDVSYDTYQDRLRAQGSIQDIISRNRMEESGGFKTFHVKKGGTLYNMDFVERCMRMKKGGNIIEKPNKNMTLWQFMKYISDTGRMSNDYDYESFYNDKGMFNKWLENELLHPSSAHFYDKYKKPNHITFSEESIYSNENMKGGRWINKDGKTYFIPTDVNIKNAGGEDKLREYFKIHEPGIILSFPDNDTLYMKNGGSFNVIPSGNLHKERHRLENKSKLFNDYTMVTSKGIPVIEVQNGGFIKQHAEIERDELIFRKEATDKLLNLMNSDDEYADLKAGELILDELFNKTQDNSGLIKRIK